MLQALSPVVTRRRTVNWRITLPVIAAVLVWTGDARADQLGMELLSTTFSLSAYQDAPRPFDEIIVLGSPEEQELPEQSALEEALLERILRDFELSQEIEKELEWRVKATSLDERLPRVRLGYDLREEAREPVREEQRLLPLDLVTPATLISLDF